MKFSTKEEYQEYAKQFFLQGYNCSQSLVLAFTDATGLDEKTSKMIASPFGAGMGRLREVCGAVSGMFIVLGTLEGFSDPEDNDQRAELYKTVQQLAGRFEEENGSIICRKLLSLGNEKESPVPEKRTSEYYKNRPCPEIVACAAGILADYLLNR